MVCNLKIIFKSMKKQSYGSPNFSNIQSTFQYLLKTNLSPEICLSFLRFLLMQFKHTQYVRGYFLWGDLNHKNFLFKKNFFSLLLALKINKKLNNKVLNSFYRFVPNQTCTFFVLFQLFLFVPQQMLL